MRQSIPLSKEAMDKLRADAEAGKADAEFRMGELYEDWKGIKPDYIEAARWYRRAFAHGLAYADGRAEGLEAFGAEHAALYQAAQAGDADSLYAFAVHEPHEATGLTGDAPRSHWLLLAAKAGSLEASTDIGRMYFRAYYKRRREMARVEWTAANPGSTLIEWLNEDLSDAPLDFDGESLEADLSSAILWLEKGAPVANASTLYDLARAYAITGAGRNMDKAQYWLTRAGQADSNLRSEDCEIAFSGRWWGMQIGFEAGPLIDYTGTPDYAAAFECYGQVGTADAAYFLGVKSHRGLGTPRDAASALSYLNDALASYRYAPEAKYELSRLYRDGPVKQRDPVQALVFLAEALPGYYRDPPRGCSGPTDSEIRQYMARNDAVEAMRKEQARLYARLTLRQKRIAIAELRSAGFDVRRMMAPGYSPLIEPQLPCMY